MTKQILKKICTFLFLFVLAFGFVGCGKKKAPVQSEASSEEATAFVTAVYQIGEVTLDSKNQIKIAKLLYNNLNSDDIQSKDVISAKALLDQCSDQYDAILEEYENDEERVVQMEKINRLIDAINKLPDLDDISKNDESAVAYALNIYKTISYEYKQIEVTKEAYKILSAAQTKIDVMNSKEDYAHFRDLVENIKKPISVASLNEVSILTSTYEGLSNTVREMDGFTELEEEYKAIVAEFNEIIDAESVHEFLTQVNSLDVVSLGSLDTINAAIDAYDMLSTITKEKDEIVAAREKLDAAIVQYKALYEANQSKLYNRYIELGASLPTVEEVGRDDYFTLSELESIYEGLSKANKETEEVMAIYEAYTALKEKFDEFEFKQIVTGTYELVVSGATDPYIIIGNSEGVYRSILENMLDTTLTGDQNYTSLLNKNHVSMMLHIYCNGSNSEEMTVKVNLEDLLGDASAFTYANLVNILKVAAVENENIQSGISYQFAISFEASEEYLPSYISNITNGIIIRWE